MKKLFILCALVLVTSCTVFEAGKMKDERKKLYEHNNNKEYCEKYPNKCVNNIPWS